MKNLILSIIFILVACSTSTFANDTQIIANGDTIVAVRGDQLDLTFLPTDNLKKLGFWTNPESNVVEEKFSANGGVFYMQPNYVLTKDTVTNNSMLMGKLGGSLAVLAPSPKEFVSNATYQVIANGDTLTGKRGDDVNVTFTPADTLRIVEKWKNPVTGKEEIKFESGGQAFYMQPGFTTAVDTTTGILTMVGVLGDNETAPELSQGTVPGWAIFSLIFGSFIVLVAIGFAIGIIRF